MENQEIVLGEIYGRSWSKIAELIPSRTGLQVKNYAQQYFKQQCYLMQLAKRTTTIPQTILDTANTNMIACPDPLSQVIASVTTAQPTTNSIPKSTSREEQKGHLSHVKGHKSEVIVPSSVRQSQIQIKNNLNNKKLSNSNLNVVKRIFANEKQNKSLKCQTNSISPEKPPNKQEKQVSKKDSLSASNTTNIVQLSPTLEEKLASSTGIIENLDRFCAVADIITGSGSADESQVEEEIDIDIENDDDSDDENPILKNRSASPNSVYERLIKAANISSKQYNISHHENKSVKSSHTHGNDLDSQKPDEKSKVNGKDESQSNRTFSNVIEDSHELSDVESNSSNSNESTQQLEKRIINAVVLGSGEVVEFPIPTEPRHFDPKNISEEEKRIHVEFFDGRASKTPERYLKIRNYILDSWKKCKPAYLNKTSVRPGLKNCGDVNCIGRVHSYLECVGAINFGCDQAAYNHPTKVPLQGQRERATRETITPENLIKLESMRPRKRRIRDSYGHWVDEKEFHGKTIEHKEDNVENPRPKSSKLDRAPFNVEIWNDALIIMDMHAHVSKTEVIGMLGGQYIEETNTLTINIVVPCNSISTGMQCEMDPVSQTIANEKIREFGMTVVGWYHSHPTFAADPSVRDIETQLKFQEWFSKGGSKFVGIIVSPYNRNNQGLCSEFQCLTISDDKSLTEKCNIPYCFNYEIVIHTIHKEQILESAESLADKYSMYNNRVEMLGSYRASTGMTCLEKMLESLKDSCEDSPHTTNVLQAVKAIFTEKFSLKDQDFIDPDIECEDDSRPDLENKIDTQSDMGLDIETDVEQDPLTLSTSSNVMDENQVTLTVQSEVVIYSDSDMCEDNVPISNIQVQSGVDPSNVTILNEQTERDTLNNRSQSNTS
ncbi:hypothetical protein KUTeg_016119 [Tegillarca granosa]|uniref:Myb-like, SWIRM and MPN domain-containing protein 1 n=1 Tax=Tegillarca granosa TaxID=220873 RepID=A0ABQ9EJX9_TEGGR|nr:hypothetical protein KUTeg_016119 [Tegillarca granosa]